MSGGGGGTRAAGGGGAPLAQLLPVCASFAVRQLEPSGTRARHSCEYSIASASSDGQMQSSSHSL